MGHLGVRAMWRPPALLAIAFLTGVGTCTSSLVPTTPSPGRGVLPPTNPPWAPTYNLSLSTIGMMINFTGWSPPEYGGKFGIVSYDWSTAKLQWAAASLRFRGSFSMTRGAQTSCVSSSGVRCRGNMGARAASATTPKVLLKEKNISWPTWG